MYLLVDNDYVADFSFSSECFIFWDRSLSDCQFIIDFEFYLIIENVSA